MKRIALTIAIVLGIAFAASAQNRGLFDRGPSAYDNQYDQSRGGDGGLLLGLPSQHGSNDDQNTPLGTGALLLIGFGAAYALKKRKK